jgi:hypothetical protein
VLRLGQDFSVNLADEGKYPQDEVFLRESCCFSLDEGENFV